MDKEYITWELSIDLSSVTELILFEILAAGIDAVNIYGSEYLKVHRGKLTGEVFDEVYYWFCLFACSVYGFSLC
jgi:hypothetical protein